MNRAQIQLDLEVEVGRIGEKQDEKVWEEDPVLVVLGPQGRQAEMAGMREPDKTNVGPLVPEDGVDPVPGYQPDVRHRRHNETKHGDNGEGSFEVGCLPERALRISCRPFGGREVAAYGHAFRSGHGPPRLRHTFEWAEVAYRSV